MAPLPHNNTAIYYADYLVSGQNHTMEVRAAGAHSPLAFGTFIAGVLGALDPALYLLTILAVRYQAATTNFSNLVTSGAEGLQFGSGAGNIDDAPKFLQFVGRSAGGRRVRMAVFGYKNAYSTFRVLDTESVDVEAAIAAFNDSTQFGFAIDGLKATWYPYLNTGLNAYWQRNLRA